MRCKRLFVVVAVALFSTFLAGCGGSNKNPTPQGGFTNGNLNGTFAMSFTGTDANGFFAVAGIITADGGWPYKFRRVGPQPGPNSGKQRFRDRHVHNPGRRKRRYGAHYLRW